ncbi:response regulator [Paenibacillus thailandensis]|uniref:Response regulator n=1 Tax=Paenibacillus thailandensis TaxID=393250 RepID=A0ABW5QZD1_9BACL
MYKLLLVDDEPEVTEGLTVEIDWERLGFTEVQTAGNGREAMELFEKLEPDVLITDISMPFMNGMELTEWVKRTYPITRIILLTGYDEFEYAKQAISLQVDDYVLKPFSGSQLTETVARVVRRMDEEREKRSNVKLLEEHYRLTLPLVREKFLSSLVTRQQPLAAIQDKADKFGLKLEGEGYLVSVIAIYHSDSEGEPGEPGEHEPGHSLAASGDLDLKLFSVLNVAEEIWERDGRGKAFIHQDRVVLLTVSRHADAAGAMDETLPTLQEIMQSIERFLRLPVSIGVGRFITEIGSLKYAYESASMALDYRRILGGNRIICITDMEEQVHEKLIFDEAKEQLLLKTVKLGTEKELEELVDRLFDDIARTNAPMREVQLYMLEMITAIMKFTKGTEGGGMDELIGAGSGILYEYEKLNSLDETKAWFGELCAKVRSRIASRRQNSYKRIVEEAIAYTKEHYGDSELSIAKLCQHLHISSGYFSTLFKRELKVTYGSYLLQIRMEAAKELLRTTDLKTFEIADKVGFADPGYFSLCFKKYAGVSAKEYRNGQAESAT